MAYNPFIGSFWTEERLEFALQAAQKDLADGKTTTQAGDGNVLIKGQVSARPETRIRLLLLALNRLNPTSWPMEDIVPITTARVVFGTTNPPNQ